MAGRKVFTREVLASADVNGYLMDQTVMRFASAAARGVAIPTPAEGMISTLDDSDFVERHDGTAWRRVAPRILGEGYIATPIVVAADPAWTDLITITATTYGGLCVADWSAALVNASSGADRTGSLRLIVDSTTLVTFGPFGLAVASLPTVPRFAINSSTPTAGSHTWKVQGNGSFASSVYGATGKLRVEER